MKTILCLCRFSLVPSTRPRIGYRTIHLSLQGLQTPPHKLALVTRYKINFGLLMRLLGR